MYRVDEQKNITACSPYDITDYLENLDYICLDVETEGLIFMKHRLTVIIVGDEENQFVIPINEDNRAMIKMVLCELEGKTVIGHYLLFDLPLSSIIMAVMLVLGKYLIHFSRSVSLPKAT